METKVKNLTSSLVVQAKDLGRAAHELTTFGSSWEVLRTRAPFSGPRLFQVQLITMSADQMFRGVRTELEKEAIALVVSQRWRVDNENVARLILHPKGFKVWYSRQPSVDKLTVGDVEKLSLIDKCRFPRYRDVVAMNNAGITIEDIDWNVTLAVSGRS